MKRLMAGLILMWVLFGLASAAIAACTTHTIFLPDGQMLICTTCCTGSSSCTTTCF